MGESMNKSHEIVTQNALLGVFAINGVMAILGTCGNAIVCVIIIRGRKMFTVANVFLMNLAIADMFVLVFLYPVFIIFSLQLSWPFGSILCKIIPSVSDAFICSSLGCMTVISIHRYRMIIYRMYTQLTIQQAKLIIILIWVISFLSISAPMYPVMEYDDGASYNTNGTSETRKACHPAWPTESYRRYFQVYLITAWYFLPLLIILYTYIRIKIFLKKTMKFEWLNDPSHFGVKTQVLGIKKALRMLAPVVIIFAILMLPHVLLRLASVITTVPYVNVLSLIAGTAVFANSAVNPFIYYIMSKEFRIEFQKQFWLLKTYLGLAKEGEEYTINEEDGRKYVRRLQSFAIEALSNHNEGPGRSVSLFPRIRSDTESTAHTTYSQSPKDGSALDLSPNFDDMFRSYACGEYQVRANGFRRQRPLTTLCEDEGSYESDQCCSNGSHCCESLDCDISDHLNDYRKSAFDIDNDEHFEGISAHSGSDTEHDFQEKTFPTSIELQDFEDIFINYSTDDSTLHELRNDNNLKVIRDIIRNNRFGDEDITDLDHVAHKDYDENSLFELYHNQNVWPEICKETIL